MGGHFFFFFFFFFYCTAPSTDLLVLAHVYGNASLLRHRWRVDVTGGCGAPWEGLGTRRASLDLLVLRTLLFKVSTLLPSSYLILSYVILSDLI